MVRDNCAASQQYKESEVTLSMTKIDIFSGFLGAGKTTLIKKLINEAFAGEKLVLIENEFGEIGIDGGFLQDAGIEVTEMNSGCICCSLVGDFGQALEKVLETYHPDRILIEPSGVGKLSDVMKAVQDLHMHDVVLNSATTVADANKCKMYMKNFGEFFNNQIEHAGCIVLSRTTGMSEDKLAACVALLRQHNAGATVITTPWEQLDGHTILEAMEHSNTLAAELEQLTAEAQHHHEHEHHHHEHGEECHCHDHDHEHEHHHHEHGVCSCGHHHGEGHHHHADEVFTSWGTETARRYTAQELTAAMAALDDSEKYGTVLRAKGIVAGADGSWLHFDHVPGEADVRTGAAAVLGRLCVIGAQLNEAALKELFRV